MNWKSFVNEVSKTERATLIDMNKAERGYNDVRFLRFFFCGNFEPLVEKYNAVGFYVMIEKSYTWHTYDLRIFWITKEQKQGEDIFNLTQLRSITEGYNQAINKLKEILK